MSRRMATALLGMGLLPMDMSGGRGHGLSDPGFEDRLRSECRAASCLRGGGDGNADYRAQVKAAEKRARRHAAGKGWPYDGGGR